MPEKHVGLVLCNQCVDLFGGLAVVEIAALHGQPLEKRADESQKNLELRYPDEIDGLAIRLQGPESLLFVNFWVVVQGAKDDFVVFRKLLYLIESPQLVSFFERIGNAGQ